MESEAEFSERLINDIKICEKWLVDEIGAKPKSFFWPWGHYNKLSTSIVKALGYKFQFTMDKDSVSADTSKDMIPRIAVPADFKRFVHQEKVFTSTSKRKIREAFNNGDYNLASELQTKSALFVDILNNRGGFNGAGKSFMKVIGIDCGPCRFPHKTFGQDELNEVTKILEDLDIMNFTGKL